MFELKSENQIYQIWCFSVGRGVQVEKWYLVSTPHPYQTSSSPLKFVLHICTDISSTYIWLDMAIKNLIRLSGMALYQVLPGLICPCKTWYNVSWHLNLTVHLAWCGHIKVVFSKIYPDIDSYLDLEYGNRIIGYFSYIPWEKISILLIFSLHEEIGIGKNSCIVCPTRPSSIYIRTLVKRKILSCY